MNATFRPPSTRPAPVLLAIAGVCAALELIFTLTDLGLFGLESLRGRAIAYGAFWPGLLSGWQPRFPGQPATMFLTYAFLHASLLHMVFNMLMLLGLGRSAVMRLGQAGFLVVYLGCAVGGGVAFALLGDGQMPMLGASGAVFGLFGLHIYWEIQARRTRGMSIEQPLRLVGGLVVMNVLLWLLVDGLLAWQAHLGGFVTGAVLARIVTPTLRHGHRPRGRRR